MKFLAGLNTTELRRLQPFLSYLLSEIEALKGMPTKIDLVYGTDEDILPTGNENKGGVLNKVARADHTHLFRFPTAVPTQLPPPDGTSYFDTAGAINIYVGGSPTTKVVASALLSDVKPTGNKTIGSAERYALADHSHPTAILQQSNAQTPVENEIRYNTNNKLVRWDGSGWVPLSVEEILPSNALPLPAGGNRSAGTSTEYSRADHRHNIVLEPDGSLTSPTDRQLGVWSTLDGIGNLCLAIYHQNGNRWELPFARPLLSQTGGVPSGKAFHTSLRSELALRTQDFRQGVLYFRRNGATTWETVGTVVQTFDQTLGITGELLRTPANITPSGQWFLRGTDNSGNVRALPLSVRTYNQSQKPTTNLPTNIDDAYGFFIQDRRLIELYPQQSDGIDRPVMLTGFQYSVPVIPASLVIGSGNNNIEITQTVEIPALRFYGSTANTNLPVAVSPLHFLPMGIRKVRIGVLLKGASDISGSFTYQFTLNLNTIQQNGTVNTLTSVNGSLSLSANAVNVYISSPLSITLRDTYSDLWGMPFSFTFRRRWDLEQTNSYDLYVLGYVLIPVRE